MTQPQQSGSHNSAGGPAPLDDLPRDELLVYGQELGLRLDPKLHQAELVRRVRSRQLLLRELDHDALLDIVVWARRPVRKSASKEALAREIAQIKKVNTDSLSRRGLIALARLRGVPLQGEEPDDIIRERIRSAEPLWDRVERTRRRVVGSVISKLVNGGREDERYRFLPEEADKQERDDSSLRDQIVDEGVVGGIARRLRGAADSYVHEKLDEIELRIDRKLEEIDRKLAEWRDREIANRLKIIRITLVASVLVALLSLGYHFVKAYLA